MTAGRLREHPAVRFASAIDIGAINSWLLAAMFFFIPIQVAPAYVIAAVILVLWIAEGRFAAKLHALAREPLVWIFLGYYAVFLLSLAWSTDTEWGWRMVRRQNFFLLFPMFLAVARREHFGRYVAAFLAAIALCELLVLYNWAQLYWLPSLPPGIRVEKSTYDTAPFVDRIMYAPALALAGYLAAHRLVFDAKAWRARLGYAALLTATTLNVLVAGGRAGVVGFLALVSLLAFQRFARRPVLAAVGAVVLSMAIVLVGYRTSDYFESRVDAAIDEAANYDQRVDSSVGIRIVLAQNAWRVYAEHPWFGAGIGDYPQEYERVRAARTPQWHTGDWNPHNQYLYALTAAGLPAGILLLLVLVYPFVRRAGCDGRERIRCAVPLLLAVICMFESYLVRSNTSMMYVLFIAACWCGAVTSRRCDAS